MGSRHPAAPRHSRNLARRLRRRPAPRLPDPPRPHHQPAVGTAAVAEPLGAATQPSVARQVSTGPFGDAILAEATRLLGAGAVDLTTTGRAIEAPIIAGGEHRRV